MPLPLHLLPKDLHPYLLRPRPTVEQRATREILAVNGDPKTLLPLWMAGYHAKMSGVPYTAAPHGREASFWRGGYYMAAYDLGQYRPKHAF